MNILKKIIFTIISIIVGLVTTYSLNYYMLNDIIIGNPNSYDTETIKTNSVFDFFYTISSNTGYRPEPSNMNFVFTLFIGLSIGLFFSYKVIWTEKKRADTSNKER